VLPHSEVRRLAEATSPRGEIVLSERIDERGSVLELRVNGVYVMDTRETSSELALARTALDISTGPDRVLVGGLGLGFTATEVLRDPRVRELVVVEIETALIGWMRDGTIAHGPALLQDPRLRVVDADLRQVIADTDERFDLVLLDVDNGPDNLVHDHNAALYDETGLRGVRRILAPGGILVIWSAGRSTTLREAMARVIGPCTEQALPVHGDSHPTDYHLYAATLADPDPTRRSQ